MFTVLFNNLTYHSFSMPQATQATEAPKKVARKSSICKTSPTGKSIINNEMKVHFLLLGRNWRPF